MDKILISVCISVHNTAAFLPRCLDSVLAQTLKNIEIVLVNNGSTDNSEDIMYQYASRYPERKWIIVSQEDRGLAQGRQTGINHATGEYLAFLDADDLVLPETYKTLYSKAVETDADIVEMQTKRNNQVISSSRTGICDARTVLLDYFSGKRFVPPMLWLRIYRRNLFEVPVLPRLYTNNEDIFAWPCLLYKAKSIAYVNEPLHIYSIDNENAVMNQLGKQTIQQKEKFMKRIRTALLKFKHIEAFIGFDVISNEFQPAYNNFKSMAMANFLLEKIYNYSYSDKIGFLLEPMEMQNQKDVEVFIRKNLPTTNIPYKLIHLFGLKLAVVIYNIIKK